MPGKWICAPAYARLPLSHILLARFSPPQSPLPMAHILSIPACPFLLYSSPSSSPRLLLSSIPRLFTMKFLCKRISECLILLPAFAEYISMHIKTLLLKFGNPNHFCSFLRVRCRNNKKRKTISKEKWRGLTTYLQRKLFLQLQKMRTINVFYMLYCYSYKFFI